MTAALRRWLPWRRTAHVRVCARIPEAEYDAIAEVAFDAAYDQDDQIDCSASWNGDWGIASVDLTGTGYNRRTVEQLRDRVLAAVRAHRLPPTETLATVCYPCDHRHYEEV